MSDLKIQGVVEMSSEGAEKAFDRVGQKADEFSRKVVQGSAQAGQAVDQIGNGASKNADEFTRSEKRIVDSIKRATTELQNLGKTASQKLELRIDARGLERAKFEPLLQSLRELEAAQSHVTAASMGLRGGLQNVSYQLQDFIVQTNGGTSAAMALSMNLPQLLGSFGAVGAAIGVVAALLPNMITLFGDSANEADSLKDAMSGMDDAISQVGRTVRAFDMEGLYEEFNSASTATRAATIEQLNFQRAFIETQRLVSQKAFSESLSGIGDFSFLDKLSGGGTAASRVADDLGVTLDVAERLAPVLKGLRDGTEDVGSAFTLFGTQLLSGNKDAVALATAMRDLANGEKDAYAASSALSEALERMAKGHVTTKKEADAAAKASKAYADETQRMAESARDLVASLLGQSSGLSADFFKKWETLGAAYKAGAISLQDLTDAQASLLAQQPAMKQAAKDAEDYGKALASTVGALEDRALVLETELQNYGLTKSQIERTTVARLEEVRAMAAANGATEDYLANLDREIAARKRIAEATAGVEAAEANRKAADDAAKEWQRTADNIEKALIDALMEGGKSGKEYIEGLFRSMVLRPIVQAIVQPVAGSITSALGVGQPGQGTLGSITGAINGVSNLSSLYGAVTGGMTASLGSLAASAGSMFGSSALSAFGAGMQGSTLAAGLAGPTTAGASGAMGLGSMAGAALPWVAGAFAVASLLGAFDKKPSDKSSWASYDPMTGRAFDVGSMTGKKDPGQEQRDATAALAMLTGGFAGLAGIDASVTAMIGGRDGTRLRINRDEGTQGFLTPQAGLANGGNSLNYGNGEDAIKRMLDDLVDEGTLPQATIDAWRAAKTDMLGAARDATELVSTLSLLVSGYDTATIERANLLQAEGEALDAALGRMLQIEAALTDTALPGDALAASAAEMARRLEALALGSVPTTNKALGELGASLDLTTDEGRKTYQSLMALAPAFLEIQAAQKSLYDQLYTDEQRAANLAVEVGDAFAQLGLAMPATRDEMRALIDSYDGSSAATAEMRAQLLGLAPAFVQVSDAAERAAKEAAQVAETAIRDTLAAARRAYDAIKSEWTGGVDQARSGLIAAYQRESAELTSLADRMRNFAGSLREARLALMTGSDSPLSRQQQYAAAAAQFAETAARATAGDESALSALASSVDTYLSASRTQATSAEQYARDVARAQAALLTAEVSAGSKATIADQQLAALREQVSALIDLNDQAISVADAIAAMQKAVVEALAAQTAAAQTMTKQYIDALGASLGADGALIAAIQDSFGAFDLDGDAQITLEELKTIIPPTLLDDSEITQLFRLLDVDKNGVLTELEGIRAGVVDLASLNAVERTIAATYVDVLKRLPQQFEVDWWEGEITAGRVSAGDLKTLFTQSAEYQNPAPGGSTTTGTSTGSTTTTTPTAWTASGYLAKNADLVTSWQTSPAMWGQFYNDINAYAKWHWEKHGQYENRLFATGGAFTNTIVKRPTAFDIALMGEAGPEAIMPLTNINGSLGVRAQMPGQDELIAEVRALRAELAELKAASAATARNTSDTARILTRTTNGGNAMLVETAA